MPGRPGFPHKRSGVQGGGAIFLPPPPNPAASPYMQDPCIPLVFPGAPAAPVLEGTFVPDVGEEVLLVTEPWENELPVSYSEPWHWGGLDDLLFLFNEPWIFQGFDDIALQYSEPWESIGFLSIPIAVMDTLELLLEETTPSTLTFLWSLVDILTLSLTESALTILSSLALQDTLSLSLTDTGLVGSGGSMGMWFLSHNSESSDPGFHTVWDMSQTVGDALLAGCGNGPDITSAYAGTIQFFIDPGWGEDLEVGRAVTSLALFGGDDYASVLLNMADGEIWQYTGSWNMIHTLTGQRYAAAMIEFNSLLLLGTVPSSGSASILSYDTSTWSVEQTFGATYTSVSAFAVYGGFLYAGTQRTSGNAAELWRSSDGSSWSLVTSFADHERISALCAHDGDLYVAAYTPGDERSVFVSSNGTSFSTSTTFPSAGTGHFTSDMVSDGTYLYVGLGADDPGDTIVNPHVWMYDGVSWILSVDFSQSPFDDTNPSVTALVHRPLTGKVYAATGDRLQHGTPRSRIYVSPTSDF